MSEQGRGGENGQVVDQGMGSTGGGGSSARVPMSALPEVARRTSEAPTIYFDYLLASVVPYAYFRGRVRGLYCSRPPKADKRLYRRASTSVSAARGRW